MPAMNHCKSCHAPVSSGTRFCPDCGAPVHASSQIPTELAGGAPGPAAGAGHTPAAATPDSPHHDHPPHPSTSGFVSEGRFTAGTILAGRYRVIGRLGRGGMGEVYRADDLTLGVPVALKFLPEGLEAQGDRMTRFLSEVRIARQISHANVCRVYDIVEADGQRFISMEYVDGEDLASLLRRIGRYPGDKGVEIARQICAGLAAAHERGVLHRDLKPANIMIDGRGKVRITDFGLAGLAGSIEGAEIQAGTPAYMAPEQLRGREVTVRSDIYSLGLVLYELFTGRPALTAESRAELLHSHATSSVPTPSSVKEDIDPAAERIILRCLEADPRDRPASALAVAAALPGGDPLAAALARRGLSSPPSPGRSWARA
jgi:serine/threonine protein kinase